MDNIVTGDNNTSQASQPDPLAQLACDVLDSVLNGIRYVVLFAAKSLTPDKGR